MIASVYLLLINDKDEVLLLRRHNTGFKDGELGLPAGHVDGGERMVDAMCREAKEEAGLNLDPKNLKLAHTMHRQCDDHERVDFFFMCKELEGEPTNAEPHKCSELVWAPLDNIPDDVIDYYKYMFTLVNKNEPYSDIGWKDSEIDYSY